MSKECKVARNVVSVAIIILAALITMLSLSSCASSMSSCPAYAYVEGQEEKVN